jgi:hypothetical protein
MLNPAYKDALHTHTKLGPHKGRTTEKRELPTTTITVYGEEEQTQGGIRCQTGAHPSTGKPTTTTTNETTPSSQTPP